ncbi:hypothetical protein HS088_TW05G00670 [Tripterygium wilfordii]|uniref:Uncharacterized protein n=1 Tax=Tripterygium wilfordii TaxID=458696 RepID=A0A7J7DNT6_TRIWF|nr:hypothetical protein HS088_TW05G00670 [Tripterygium wilfordii]
MQPQMENYRIQKEYEIPDHLKLYDELQQQQLGKTMQQPMPLPEQFKGVPAHEGRFIVTFCSEDPPDSTTTWFSVCLRSLADIKQFLLDNLMLLAPASKLLLLSFPVAVNGGCDQVRA